MEFDLDKDILTEAYTDYLSLLTTISWTFRKKFGGEFNSILSEASKIFILTFRSHDKSQGPLKSRIRFKVWNGLIDWRRKEIRYRMYRKQPVQVIMDLDEVRCPERQYFLEDFMTVVPDEAKVVVHLLINPPCDLEIHNKGRKETKDRIRQYLLKQGYDKKTISQLFANVTEALTVKYRKVY